MEPAPKGRIQPPLSSTAVTIAPARPSNRAQSSTQVYILAWTYPRQTLSRDYFRQQFHASNKNCRIWCFELLQPSSRSSLGQTTFLEPRAGFSESSQQRCRCRVRHCDQEHTMCVRSSYLDMASEQLKNREPGTRGLTRWISASLFLVLDLRYAQYLRNLDFSHENRVQDRERADGSMEDTFHDDSWTTNPLHISPLLTACRTGNGHHRRGIQ
jgi:hypothetical protein